MSGARCIGLARMVRDPFGDRRKRRAEQYRRGIDPPVHPLFADGVEAQRPSVESDVPGIDLDYRVGASANHRGV